MQQKFPGKEINILANQRGASAQDLREQADRASFDGAW